MSSTTGLTSVSGLVSGLDTQSIIDQLIAASARPNVLRKNRLNAVDSQITAYQDLNTKFLTLGTSLENLRINVGSSFDKTSVSSSNSAIVTATSDSTAQPGAYTVDVTQLAQNDAFISQDINSIRGENTQNITFASVTGSDLNPNIDASTTKLASLNRRDNNVLSTNNIDDSSFGTVTFTDRTGTATTVNLASEGLSETSTVQSFIDKVNTALTAGGTKIALSVNAGGNGLTATDTSGGGGNLVIADTTGTLAAGLNLAANAAANTQNSNDLNPELQADTALTVLNGGAGFIPDVPNGSGIQIDQAAGTKVTNVDLAGVTTFGGVLDAINNSSADANAKISSDGTGLDIGLTVSGQTLDVRDAGGGSTDATKLGVNGLSSAAGTNTITINGTTVTLSGTDLVSVRNSINSTSGVGVTASILNNRLLVSSSGTTGSGSSITFSDNRADNGVLEQLGFLTSNAADSTTTSTKTTDASSTFLNDSTSGGQFTAGQDALFTVNGVPAVRSTNTGISDVLPGLALNLAGKGSVTLTVANDNTGTSADVQTFVNAVNDILTFIDDNTKINLDDSTKNGVLQGDSFVLRLKDQIINTFSDPNTASSNKYNSLLDVVDSGGSFAFEIGKFGSDNEGKIVFNQSVFDNLLSTNRQDLENVFAFSTLGGNVANAGTGFRMDKFVKDETITNGGLLNSQIDSLNTTKQSIQDSIDQFQLFLDSRRAQLEKQFTNLETTLGGLKNSGNFLSAQLSSLGQG